MNHSPLNAVLDALAPALTNRDYWRAELDNLHLPENDLQFATNFPRAAFARWLQRVRPMAAAAFWARLEDAQDTSGDSVADKLTFAAAFAGFVETLESDGISHDDATDIVAAGEHAYSVALQLCTSADLAWLREDYLPQLGIPIGGGKSSVTEMRTTILSELHQLLQAALSPLCV